MAQGGLFQGLFLQCEWGQKRWTPVYLLKAIRQPQRWDFGVIGSVCIDLLPILFVRLHKLFQRFVCFASHSERSRFDHRLRGVVKIGVHMGVMIVDGNSRKDIESLAVLVKKIDRGLVRIDKQTGSAFGRRLDTMQ